MKNVFKLFVGNPEQLNEMLKNEVLFEIDGQEIWCPIQLKLEYSLKDEVVRGKIITLYCLFLNEYAEFKTLRYTFFISEFKTE
jgi:hypothetical protein